MEWREAESATARLPTPVFPLLSLLPRQNVRDRSQPPRSPAIRSRSPTSDRFHLGAGHPLPAHRLHPSDAISDVSDVPRARAVETLINPWRWFKAHLPPPVWPSKAPGSPTTSAGNAGRVARAPGWLARCRGGLACIDGDVMGCAWPVARPARRRCGPVRWVGDGGGPVEVAEGCRFRPLHRGGRIGNGGGALREFAFRVKGPGGGSGKRRRVGLRAPGGAVGCPTAGGSRLLSLFSGKSGKRFAGPPTPRGGFGKTGPGRRYTRLGHDNPMLSKRLGRLPASLPGLPALARTVATSDTPDTRDPIQAFDCRTVHLQSPGRSSPAGVAPGSGRPGWPGGSGKRLGLGLRPPGGPRSSRWHLQQIPGGVNHRVPFYCRFVGDPLLGKGAFWPAFGGFGA